MSITIDPEFQALIPPLSSEEYAQLEANIRRDGCREPLVIWNGLVLDGHNRKAICEQHGLPYQTTTVECADRNDAKIWIIHNQFGRRNMPPFVRVELALKLEPLIAAKAKANQRTHTDQGYLNSGEAVTTDKELAKIARVGHDQVHRTRVIQRQGSNDLKVALRQDKISLNHAYRQIRPHGSSSRPAAPPPRPVKPAPDRRKLRPETQATMEETIKTKYRDYGAYVLQHLAEPQRSEFLRNSKVAESLGKPIRWPRPSEVFAGLNPGLDDRLIREQHDQDVPLLEAMAKVPPEEQAEFYERYLKNPEQAKLWASLPRWKRPLINKTPQDELIWKLFTIIRLELEYFAQYMEGGLPGQGYRLCQKAGLLDSITDMHRLASVLSTYGSMLKYGHDLGNVTEPPWKNGR